MSNLIGRIRERIVDRGIRRLNKLEEEGRKLESLEGGSTVSNRGQMAFEMEMARREAKELKHDLKPYLGKRDEGRKERAREMAVREEIMNEG